MGLRETILQKIRLSDFEDLGLFLFLWLKY